MKRQTLNRLQGQLSLELLIAVLGLAVFCAIVLQASIALQDKTQALSQEVVKQGELGQACALLGRPTLPGMAVAIATSWPHRERVQQGKFG